MGVGDRDADDGAGGNAAENAEADRGATALREGVGRRRRESNREGRRSGERGEGLHHRALDLIGRSAVRRTRGA